VIIYNYFSFKIDLLII